MSREEGAKIQLPSWGVSGSVPDMGVKGAALQAGHKAGVPFRVPSCLKRQLSAASAGDLDTWPRSDHASVLLRWHPPGSFRPHWSVRSVTSASS